MSPGPGPRTAGEAPVALVTGSTRGIGWAVAQRLASGGHRVALNHRSDELAAARALSRLRAVAPEAICVRADLAEPEAAEALVKTVLQRWGRLDALVNNVGPMIEASASDTTPEQWRAMVGGNADSAFHVTHHALEALRESRGSVVNLGSVNVEHARGADRHAAYNAAKAALVVLTRSWARSEGRHGVRFNMVSPGIIDTAPFSPDTRKAVEARIPLGRLGRPEEVAEAVSWLLSERAAYVSGAVLTVAGGLWA